MSAHATHCLLDLMSVTCDVSASMVSDVFSGKDVVSAITNGEGGHLFRCISFQTKRFPNML
jgi:hypothetical protein